MTDYDVDLAIRRIARTSQVSAMMREVRYRASEFPTSRDMALAVIASDQNIRERFSALLGAYTYRRQGYPVDTVPEVIIGAGIHAAIYAAIRYQRGAPRPTVIEKGYRAGGVFALSEKPSFYLNSENRRGPVGTPRQGDALNVIPGGLIQPAFLSSEEYPTNSDMAFAIQLTLAAYASVVTGSEVVDIDDYSKPIIVTLANGRVIETNRVIDARGLGIPRDADQANGANILTAPQFLARQDDTFPLAGFKRVAVIGNGDSARVSVEALVGLSPARSMSLRGLDQIERVDWYAPGLPRTNEAWRDTERGRYSRLASYLPSNSDRDAFHDVTISGRRGEVINLGDGMAQVNGKTYDHVILATGNNKPGPLISSRYTERFYATDSRSDAIAQRAESGAEYYQVGPICNIPFSSSEDDLGISGKENNRVAIFRYAPKTAALAAMLPSIES